MVIALLLVGFLAMFVGGIMLLVAAFRESMAWGLCYLFVPFAFLIYVIKYWDDSKKGFAVSMAGLVVCAVGIALAPEGIQQTSTFP